MDQLGIGLLTMALGLAAIARTSWGSREMSGAKVMARVPFAPRFIGERASIAVGVALVALGLAITLSWVFSG
jgi:hypothetical protein